MSRGTKAPKRPATTSQPTGKATKRAAKPAPARQVSAPFGQENRRKLIAGYLEEHDPRKSLPRWQLIYQLLLWVDQTTGLAHCYESDKCQPGKPWYPRSLRFHAWLAEQFDCSPPNVESAIDWLFTVTSDQFAELVLFQQHARLMRAAKQRAGFAGFPEAAYNTQIVAIIREMLGDRLRGEPTMDEWRRLTQRVREVIAVENKRKNLLGEGFEDVLALVLSRSSSNGGFDIKVREPLRAIEGFANIREGDKANKVDLAISGRGRSRPTLVTVKWSIRADRERQFPAEFGAYVAAHSGRTGFDYSLVTNEFDPARLVRACEGMAGNNQMFTHVVHINCDALRAVYGESPEPTMQRALEYTDVGRLISIDSWLGLLRQQYKAA